MAGVKKGSRGGFGPGLGQLKECFPWLIARHLESGQMTHNVGYVQLAQSQAIDLHNVGVLWKLVEFDPLQGVYKPARGYTIGSIGPALGDLAGCFGV